MKAVMATKVLIGCLSVSAWCYGAEPEQCLNWTVETHNSASKASSCAYYMRDKVSTRFLVQNQCESRVSGVFSYTREDAVRPLSVQAFDVEPGEVEEVANPCDEAGDWRIQVSQGSY